MLLPVITEEGTTFFLEPASIFSVTLNGVRIEYKTIDNKRYYQPLAIEEVALFLKDDQENVFHSADRKNLVNLSNVNYLNSETQQLHNSDHVKVEASRSNIKSIKAIKPLEDISEQKERGRIVEYAPMTRRKSLFNFGR